MAPDMEVEFENIRLNPTTLISPRTADLAAAGFRITGLAAATTAGDLTRFDDIPLIATQAQQETGSSATVAVTPGRQQFHQSAAKMWASLGFGGENNGSYNVASVTDVGTGQVLATFTVAPSAAGVFVSCADNTGTPLALQSNATASAAYVLLAAKNTAGAATDPSAYFVCGFGDLA